VQFETVALENKSILKEAKMSNISQLQLSRNLMRYGILLFLLGLITGFAIPAMENPRMGLSSHLEGVMNGMFLVLAGLIWPKLRLSDRTLNWGYGLSLFGTYTNWATTLLAGIWGAGAEMMPIAGGGFQGEVWQEIIIKFGLISLSVAMIIVCGLMFWGLRGRVAES
jgi:hydroxylaminobenzene mutase